MKRVLLVVVLGLVVSGVLFAAGGQEQTKEITMDLLVTSGTAAQFEAVKPIFEQENPGVKIQITAPGYMERYNKIVTTMPAQPAALDIVGFGNDEVPVFTEGKWLVDITNNIPKELLDDMLPGAKDVLAYKGRIYGIPWSLSTKVFYYNKGMLQKAGFSDQPQTWDELIGMSKAMQKAGISKYGILFGWQDIWVDFPIFAALHGIPRIISPDGLPEFNNPKGVQTVKFMRDLIEKEKIASPSSVTNADHEVMASFLGGQTPFQLHWPFIAAMINDPAQSKIVDQAHVGMMPGIPPVKSATLIGTMGLGVSSGSKNKDMALKFVLFTGRKDIHKKMILTSKEVPIRESLVQDKEIQADNPLMLIMADQFRYGVDMPKSIWWGEIRPILNENINKGVAGMVSAEEAVKAVADGLQKLADKKK